MSKYYAVSRGRRPGIYDSWEEAKKQVDHYPTPIYKSFKSENEAINWKNEADRLGKYPKRISNPLDANISSFKRHETKLGKAQREHQEEAENAPDGYIRIFTDGGSRNSGYSLGGHLGSDDLAAWAFEAVYPDGTSYHDSGAELGKSNQKMELEAFAKACEFVINQRIKAPIMFILDSRYVLNPLQVGDLKKWANNGWKEERANKEYWQQIWNAYSQINQKVYLKWVKGHSVTQGNNDVDKLANEAMDTLK
ncbi:ribonuclease h [Lactobacillus phage Lbab1]|nr:ribonuclease h [Lactobacillus phage Lbab1]